MTASRHSEQPLDPTPISDSRPRPKRQQRRDHPGLPTSGPGTTTRTSIPRPAQRRGSPRSPGPTGCWPIRRPAPATTPAAYHAGPGPPTPVLPRILSPWPATWVRPDRIPHDAFWLAAAGLTPPFHLNADLPVRSPRDDETELELTLQESYQGTTRTVTVTSQDSCESIHVVVPPGTIDGDRIEVPTISPRGGGNTPPVVPASGSCRPRATGLMAATSTSN